MAFWNWVVVVVLMTIAVAIPVAVSAQEPPPGRRVDIVHYTAYLVPDLNARTIQGSVRIRFVALSESSELNLDSGHLSVKAVREGASSLAFTRADRQLRIHLTHPTRAGETREIEVEYAGAPSFGLNFVPERSQIYTVFSTSEWLICVDAPDERATLHLSVELPRGLTAVGSGSPMLARTLNNDVVIHEWRVDQPVPSYTFGFAAGKFSTVTMHHGDLELNYLAEGFSDRDLTQVFRDSRDMIDFFEERAGVRYPASRYSQVLVAKTIGQEMSGLAIFPETYGRSVVEHPPATSLGAHELAHQWWGNLITCADWTHFWLNEGFATFMAAAYQERRAGRGAYLAAIETSRARYETVRTAGADRPLVFPDWKRPTAADRTLVYHKAAYVLHLLREMLGDPIFWKGIRHYTRAHVGQSVTSMEFQRSMEQSSGKDLSGFFERWVYSSDSAR